MYVGDGALRYRELLEERGGVVPPTSRTSATAHEPGFTRSSRGTSVPVEEIEPLYLRVPDAVKSAR